MDLLTGILAGDKRLLARAITLVENGDAEAPRLIRELYPLGGKAHVVGVTGAPGVGKSTLVNAIAGEYRRQQKRVGILAVDPTSPFTGGAILGDRIRMQERGTDPGVFIRSLASRGHPGGLSLAAGDVLRVMDAAGYEVILVETVGAGQGEVEIMRYAHTTLVLLVPGLGDEIQALKAGILEIGNVFVVNKADLGGAERVVMELETMLDMAPGRGWRPPIVRTVARDGQGLLELVGKIEEHRQYLVSSGEAEKRLIQESGSELREVLGKRIVDVVLTRARANGSWEEMTARVARRELDPYSAADEIIARHVPELQGLLNGDGPDRGRAPGSAG